MPDPIRLNAGGLDLSPRVRRTATVAGSPADATETVIASLTIPGDLATSLGVVLMGWCSLTVGTNGTSILTRIRQTSVGGTVVKASGATTAVAAQLVDRAIMGVDAAPALPNQVYVLTLTVGAATAASTVSAVELVAIVV